MKYILSLVAIMGVVCATPGDQVTWQIFEKLAEYQRQILCEGEEFVFDIERIPHVSTETVLEIKDKDLSSIELKIVPEKKTESRGLVYDFLYGIAEKKFPDKAGKVFSLKQEIGSWFNNVAYTEITSVELDKHTHLIETQEFGKLFFVFKINVPASVVNEYMSACKERYRQQKENSGSILADQLFVMVQRSNALN